MKLHESVTHGKSIITYKKFKKYCEDRNEYDYSKSIFIGNKEDITITCNIHGGFRQIPDTHKYGAGCPQCSLEKRIKKDIDKHKPIFLKKMKNRGITFLSDYLGSKKHIECECDVCGNLWSTSAGNLLCGKGCNVCATKRSAVKQRRTHAEMEELLIGKTIKIESKYQGANIKSMFSCDVCLHTWETTPAHVLNGTGCPKCAGQIVKTHSEFIKDYEENYNKNEKLNIIGKFIGADKLLKCICVKCDKIVSLKAYHFLRGQGCAKCAGKKLKTHKEFKKELKIIDNSIKLKSKYVNSKTNIECQCKVCKHKWLATPSNLTRLRGCPECAVGGFKSKAPAELYLYNIDAHYLGFGITGDAKQRHASHKHHLTNANMIFKHTHTFCFNKGSDAQRLENILKDKFTRIRIEVKGFRTETISIDYLDAVLLEIDKFKYPYAYDQFLP